MEWGLTRRRVAALSTGDGRVAKVATTSTAARPSTTARSQIPCCDSSFVPIDGEGVMKLFMTDGRILTAAGNAKGPKGATGDTGEQGLVGADGPSGANGAPGTNGISSLVHTLVEAAGDKCVAGGIRIEHGLDSNRSGTLDDDEVTGTEYVCNGANADPGCALEAVTVDGQAVEGMVSLSCGGQTPVLLRSASCGDGAVDPNEQCDDGNQLDRDACTNLCKTARCGDSIVWVDQEECDDGNTINNDDCSNACSLPRCGDDILQAGEQCDDGNTVNDDDCSNVCELPRCGDGITQENEACDDGDVDDANECSNTCTANAPCAQLGTCPTLEFVALTGGSFQMGSTNYDTSQPIHPVNVPSFQMGPSENWAH